MVRCDETHAHQEVECRDPTEDKEDALTTISHDIRDRYGRCPGVPPHWAPRRGGGYDRLRTLAESRKNVEENALADERKAKREDGIGLTGIPALKAAIKDIVQTPAQKAFTDAILNPPPPPPKPHSRRKLAATTTRKSLPRLVSDILGPV